MLTFRTFEAGPPSTALGMARHILTQTLPPDEVVKQARYRCDGPLKGRNPTLAVAIVKPDLHPRLTSVLGIEPGIVPTHKQLASLLAGRHSDGSSVRGRQMQRSSKSLADELGLDLNRFATVEEARAIFAGARADNGSAFPRYRPAMLRKRFLALYGLDAEIGDQEA